MKHIEQLITALPSLDGKGRAALRKQVADCINGVSDMPERGPDWIHPADYGPIRRAAILEQNARQCAGQIFDPKKALAFYHRGNGGMKPSVIMPHKYV